MSKLSFKHNFRYYFFTVFVLLVFVACVLPVFYKCPSCVWLPLLKVEFDKFLGNEVVKRVIPLFLAGTVVVGFFSLIWRHGINGVCNAIKDRSRSIFTVFCTDRTLVVLGVSLLAFFALISVIITYLVPENGVDASEYLTLFSVVIGLCALIISFRVFFEVREDKFVSLDLFLKRLMDVFNMAERDDVILIALPTMFLGLSTASELEQYKYIDQMINFLDQGNGKILLATLGYVRPDCEKLIRYVEEIHPLSELGKYHESSIMKFSPKKKEEVLTKLHATFRKVVYRDGHPTPENMRKNLIFMPLDGQTTFKLNVENQKAGPYARGFWSIVNLTQKEICFGGFEHDGLRIRIQGSYINNVLAFPAFATMLAKWLQDNQGISNGVCASQIDAIIHYATNDRPVK